LDDCGARWPVGAGSRRWARSRESIPAPGLSAAFDDLCTHAPEPDRPGRDAVTRTLAGQDARGSKGTLPDLPPEEPLVGDSRFFIARWPCCRLLKDARATVMIPVSDAEVRAWQLCDGRHTGNEILDELKREFGDDPTAAGRAADFLRDLLRRGIVRTAPAGGSAD